MSRFTSLNPFLHANSSPHNATATPVVLGYFENLAKTWNISIKTLIFIGIGCVIGLVFILVIIICYIKRKNAKDRKPPLLRKAPVELIGDDNDKYDSPYGFIDMIITYDRKKKVMKIQNLTISNISNIGQDIPDCFIKVFLKNKDGKKIQLKKTRTIEDNLSPNFPEVFNLKIDDLDGCIVYFQVFDENKNGNDTPMGDGELIVNNIPRESFIGSVYPGYVVLQKPTETEGCGEVCVILTYNPPKLKITVLEAKSLVFQYSNKINKNVHHFPSVYALVKTFVSGHKKKTFKSKSVENTRNPYFYESFEMDINTRDLYLSVVKVELHEYMTGRLSKRIGRACIGNKIYNPLVNELGKKHMDSVCSDFKTPHAMWHALIKD